MVLTKSKLETLYRSEENPKVKERLLFILRVEGDGAVPSQVAERELHRSRPWASFWLERYFKEGAEGLNDKPRNWRPPKLPANIALAIRRELAKSNQGWTTEQVAEMIAERGGVEYHFTHVYSLLYKWGFKQKAPRKEHINTASKEEKEDFKKGKGDSGVPPGKVYHSSSQRVVLLLRLSHQEGMDRSGKETSDEGHGLPQALVRLRCVEPRW